MLAKLLYLLLLPVRTLFYFWRLVSFRIRKGDHFFLDVPSSFSYDKKSFFIKFFLAKEENPFFVDFLIGLRTLSRVKGLRKISLHFELPEYGYGEVWNLCQSILSLKKKGIKVAGYSLGGGVKSLLLLSHCDERYSSSASEFFPVLPSAEPYFFGGTAKKFGVNVEAYASGAFKAFGETFQRTSFSPPAKKNLESLLSDQKQFLEESFRATSGLKLSLLEEPILTAEQLYQNKFLTDLIEEDSFRDNYTFKDYNSPNPDLKVKPDYKSLSVKALILHSKLEQFKLLPKFSPIVVVLPIQGNILPDLGREEDFRSRQVSYRYYKNILKDLKEDPKVSAVVLEMNSPGGSALVSELLYREIKKVSEVKPVYTYVLNVAASGGYYLACGSHEIHSSPYSIVGSIGAVMLRLDMKGLYEKVGVKKERIGFYPYREILSEYGKLGKNSEQFLKKEVLRSRDQFYQRVIESRKTSHKELESKWGEGRVFIGKTFQKAGFIDSCSSLLEILDKAKAKIGAKNIRIKYWPGTYSWKDLIHDLRPGLAQKTILSRFSFLEEAVKTFANSRGNLYYSDLAVSILEKEIN
ncbi:serine protease [Leptospira perolatii]|uniref:Serine protease n=1 Tax=Leptospira perolatii TaxID=2023191 RepID=A0A2M9ZK27_9LEPT|nr:S49 family peptidase [Leptospira perolatii]PJZ69468.1 serine protease [Leptospira perolatii]PJZ72293.1 serine protease [Leptospira perolatii]